MEIALIIGFIISIFLNMYFYSLLKRYQVKNNRYNGKWREVMGLNHPLSVFLWIILLSSILIGVPVILSVFFN